MEEKKRFSVIAWIINAFAVGLLIGTTFLVILLAYIKVAKSALTILRLAYIPRALLAGLGMGAIGLSVYAWTTRTTGPAWKGLVGIAALIAFYVVSLAVIRHQVNEEK